MTKEYFKYEFGQRRKVHLRKKFSEPEFPINCTDLESDLSRDLREKHVTSIDSECDSLKSL